ncbi:MAG: HU family DNA-binding protein [Paludibacteraceae bacterium]|nr:HU family DNA-binding protein [Paludibacteraceae bacterium]
MAKITNTNILSTFRKQLGISKTDEVAFVEAFQSTFEEALLRDKMLKISGLGTFKLIPVESRKSVNVNTGEEIEIAGHYKLTFTPDVALKDKVNEPLAHLETMELDATTDDSSEVVVEQLQVSPIKEAESIELPQSQDDPLQKLTEQALELKDILADIQGFGLATQDLVEEETILEAQPEEVIVEPEVNKEEQEPDTKEVVVAPQEAPKHEEPKHEAPQTPVVETPIVEPSPKPQESTSVVAKDIVNAINQEDNKSANKRSSAWIWVAVILFLGVIGLLVYQNLDFFSQPIDTEVDTLVVVNVEPEPEVVISQPEDSLLIVNAEIDTIEAIKPQQPIDTIVIDKTSPIYSDQFSDIFNRERKHTEFIDTVTLNEGSRLTWISLKQYGHKDYWVYIYEANHDIINNPNSIKIGTQLRIPKLAPELIDTTNPETIEYARYLHDVYVKK